MFHKTSAAFDEGGTGGLLLNHLFVRDDSCELLLDSASVTMTTRDVSSEGQTTQDNSMVDLSELRGETHHKVLHCTITGFLLHVLSYHKKLHKMFQPWEIFLYC